MKKLIYFVIGEIIVIILFLCGIGIYIRASSNPIIFFASLIIGIITTTLSCFIIQKFSKKLFQAFTLFIIAIAYYLSTIILAIFGPTFIDRSISYYIIFYATEKGNFYVQDIEKEFSKDIFEKRIHDALNTGFLTQNKNGSVSPTIKSKIMYTVLKPIGELTNSLDTYYEMKEKVEK